METNNDYIIEIGLGDLDKAYTNTDKEQLRYDNLLTKFKERYEKSSQFIVRAPGRVNLIGEHIDYAGFAVLPMAIGNDMLIAAAVEDNETGLEVHVNHLDSKWQSYMLKLESSYLSMVQPHDWINYTIAGINAILFYIGNKGLSTVSLKKTIKLLVTGNVPIAAGLSSSSALTVCSALTIAKALGTSGSIKKEELAQTTIDYERSVGTACGGMDQTISVFAEKGTAKLIEFCPKLNLKSVKLPSDVSFVIANSLTESTKIDTLAFRYNKRVVENKLGLAIICKNKNINICPILHDLKTILSLDYDDLKKVIEENLKEGEYSHEDLKKEIDNIDEILKQVPYFQDVLSKNTGFNLRSRLIHVCCEAKRVEDFHNICNNSNPDIVLLGDLMNQSHQSCKDLYECSSNELDRLVEFSLNHKALGARLTGAGWGGCCVIMIRNEDLDDFLAELDKYYKGENKDYYFNTKPGQGALIITT
jgi:N-acetylgalactosamine kinase